MSDLISRSALIKELKDLADKNYDDKQSYFALMGAIGRVQDAPLAYDIEKVVAELETRQDDIQVDISLHDFYIQGYSSAIDYAINIVRKGGVE